MIETIGPHRAEAGSPAAVLLQRAEVEADARAAAEAAEDETFATVHACAATRLRNAAFSSQGYIGPALDVGTVETARVWVEIHGCDKDEREDLVDDALLWGVDEAVARRSVAAGMMRALNPEREPAAIPAPALTGGARVSPWTKPDADGPAVA